MAKQTDIVDVLIVGAGASGAAFAWSLADEGIDVACLEQGGWPDPASYPPSQQDWEARRQTDFSADPNVRGLAEDYPVDSTESPITPLMYNAVGGSTIHWGAEFPRMHPSDFKVKTLDGVADDWPISYEDLEPYYDLNDRMIGVAGLDGDPAYPPKSPRQTPPVPLGLVGDTLAAGFDKLGWHWWPFGSAVLTRPYDGRSACNNCGPCDLGCTRGAKASADVTYWPKSVASGVTVTTGVRVNEITLGKDGLADRVTYFDSEGNLHKQLAKVVVMACNGVGTTRLLLNSRSGLFPDGLANSSGLVGKNLIFHPVAKLAGVFDEPLNGHNGPAGCVTISHEFYETDTTRGFVRGYALYPERSSGPLHAALGGIVGHPVPWGADHHRVFKERFGHTAMMSVCGEDLPEEHNRVELDASLTDGNGIPAPKVYYTMSENSQRMMDHGVASATTVLEVSGARQVLPNPLVKAAGWHLLGTARMGDDPSSSVVDRLGRSHDVPNLLVIDGSVFVTCGAVNPTSTIQALALYFADHLKRAARHLLAGERPSRSGG